MLNSTSPSGHGCAKETLLQNTLPHEMGLLTVIDNMYKVYSNIIYVYHVCMLTNNVPMGWGTFSVLTPVNVNCPTCAGRGVWVTFD